MVKTCKEMNLFKMKKYNWLIIGLSLSMLQSCVTDADVDVPKVDPKLVIQGFLSPQDEIIQIRVSKSKPVFGIYDEDSYYIENAVVRLMSNTDTTILEYDSQLQTYSVSQLDYPIEGGRTYALEVSAPGLKSVYATTTVPTLTPDVSSADYVSTQNFEGGNFGEYSTTFEYNVQWMDNEPGESFYRLILGLEGTGSGSEPVDLLLTDVLNEGEVISKNVFVGTWYSDINPEQEPFGIYLLTVDENYYRYHLTTNSIGGDDPFTEPVQVYSNITNGLGCFGSFNGTYEQF
jgi:Domain of unknown function (DUF4249)